MLFAFQAQVTEDVLQACAQIALYKAGLDGEPQACEYQQEQQDVVSQVAVDFLYKGSKVAFKDSIISLLL